MTSIQKVFYTIYLAIFFSLAFFTLGTLFVPNSSVQAFIPEEEESPSIIVPTSSATAFDVEIVKELDLPSFSISQQTVLPLLEGDSFSLPIILYHSVQKTVSSDSENVYIISENQLREDLMYLQEKGYTPVHMQDIINFVYFNGDLPEKPILLTFDDGYEDNYTVAYPVLKEFQMKAVVCLITSYFNPWRAIEDLPHLTTEQVLEMQKSGLIEFQCHTYDFHFSNGRRGSLPLASETASEYESAFSEDLSLSRDMFRESNLFFSTTFSYPGGLVTAENSRIVKDSGFVASFVTYPVKTNIVARNNPDSLMNLTRLNRDHGISTEVYFRILFDYAQLEQ